MANIERRRFLQGAAALTVGSALVGATGQSAQAAPAPEALTGAPATRRLRFDTPGGQDFPKVGGNLGNQNYSALGAHPPRQHPPPRRRLGQPHRGRPHHRHQPEHRGRRRRRALHRVGARQRVRRGRRDRGHEVDVPADPRHPDPARRRRRRRQGLHPRPRQLDHRAGPGDRRGRLGEADHRLRQHGEGRGHLPRRRAPRRHPRRRPRRRAGARRRQRRPALALLGRARARASSATTPGRATPGRPAAPRRGCIRPLDPDLGLVYWTFGNARGSRSSQDGSAARPA